jgi:hypothetical protein
MKNSTTTRAALSPQLGGAKIPAKPALWLRFGLVLCAVLASSCTGGSAPCCEDAQAPIAVSEARLPAPPPGSGVGAVYLTLVNHSDRDDRLLGVDCAAARHAELHETSQVDGVMQMRASPDGYPLARGETLVLAPGGKHIMLMGLAETASAGSTVPVVLTFAHAEPLTVPVVVTAR